jgi:hypothetical protein
VRIVDNYYVLPAEAGQALHASRSAQHGRWVSSRESGMLSGMNTLFPITCPERALSWLRTQRP